MDATINIKRRAAVLLTAAGLMLTVGSGVALAAAIPGSAQNDTLIGTPKNDRISGFGDSDRIFGRDGNDRLIGGNDSDVMVGGPGDDVIDANEPGRLDGDRIDCGAGFDRVINALPTEDIIRANCEIVRR